MRYIFVHIPKTAGTSLVNAITQRFGAHNVLMKYGHRPPPMNWWHATKEQVVGHVRQHIWPHRYVVGHVPVTQFMDAHKPGTYTKRFRHRYMTFLRDPLSRAISHYYYWHQIKEPRNPRWVQFHTEQWTLEEFLLNPNFANFHMRFIRGLDIDEFDFVGIVEEFPLSMQLLGRLFPEFAGIEVLQSRKTKFKDTETIDKLSPRVIDEFSALHRADYDAYERARDRVLNSL